MSTPPGCVTSAAGALLEGRLTRVLGDQHVGGSQLAVADHLHLGNRCKLFADQFEDRAAKVARNAPVEALIRKTIKELIEELDPGAFWQIHRAVLVNVRAIDSVLRDGNGGLAVRLKQRPETLAVSEQHRHLFRQM